MGRCSHSQYWDYSTDLWHRIFVSLGELGPGNNIGLCAAKSSATAIRGQYYGIAAAAGKTGAFVGTYVTPIVEKNAPNEVRSGQDPFFVSSALCVFSAIVAFLFFPKIGQVNMMCLATSLTDQTWLTLTAQDTITEEDAKFREFLSANGYDTSTLGNNGQIPSSANVISAA